MNMSSPTNPPSGGSAHSGALRELLAEVFAEVARTDSTADGSLAGVAGETEAKSADADRFAETEALLHAAHADAQMLNPRSRRGRHPIDPELRRTHRVTICLSDEEYLFVQRLAPSLDPTARRVRMAEWVRDRIFDREPPILHPMIAEQDRTLVGLATNMNQIAKVLNECRLRGLGGEGVRATLAAAKEAAGLVAEVQTLMSEAIANAAGGRKSKGAGK